MTAALYMLMAVAIGSAVALQGVVNSRLRAQWGLAPAILLNSVVVIVLSLALWAVAGTPWPERARLAGFPWVLYLGGAFGFFIIVASAVVFGRLSATVALALVLVGQFSTALLVDVTGWLGMPRQPVTPVRVLGLLFLALGVALLRR